MFASPSHPLRISVGWELRKYFVLSVKCSITYDILCSNSATTNKLVLLISRTSPLGDLRTRCSTDQPKAEPTLLWRQGERTLLQVLPFLLIWQDRFSQTWWSNHSLLPHLYNTCAGCDHYGADYSPALLSRNTPYSPFSWCFEIGSKGNIPVSSYLTLYGWFTDRGEIIAFVLTGANVRDKAPNVFKVLAKRLYGKLFADKGYILQKLFDFLFEDGIQLVTDCA